MKLSIKHFNKQSNKKLKRIADIFMYAIPLYNPIILALPLDPVIISWVIGVSNTIVASFKLFTKFTIEESIVANIEDSEVE